MNQPKTKETQTTQKPNSMIRVAVIDDDASFLAAMKMMFNASKEFKCVGTYQDPHTALQEIIKSPPDVVLMDIRMDGPSIGIECTRRLKRVLPNVGVITVTGYTERANILKSVIAGATGYLLKPAHAEEYRQAVRQVAHRKIAFAEPLLTEIIHALHSPNVGTNHGLTAREQEVLLLLVAKQE